MVAIVNPGAAWKVTHSFFTPSLVIWFLVFVRDAKGGVNVAG
jgi:hypothetical protein